MRPSHWLSLAMLAVLVWVLVHGARTLKERSLQAPAMTAAPAPTQVAAAPAPMTAPEPPVYGTTVPFPGARAADLVSQCSRWPPAIDGGWDISPEDLVQLEVDFARIAALEAHRCCADGARVPDPLAFHRQVVGVVYDGRRMIYVSAVGKTEPDPSWHAEPVRVCDGGATFWGVLYDPLTREFSELAVNGGG